MRCVYVHKTSNCQHDSGECSVQYTTKSTVIMTNILAGSIRMFQVIGFWRPIHWISPWKYLYTLYTTVGFFLIYSFSISGIIGIIHSHKNTTDMINDCFVLLSIIVICGKIFNIVKCRRTIILISQALSENPCAPRNKKEEDIQNSVDHFIWISTLIYGGLTEITVFMITIGTLFQDMPTGTLPFNTYIPWDYSHGFKYWIAYAYQIISVILSANVDIAYDTFVPGMMLQICAKLHLLKYRLVNLPNRLNQIVSITDQSNDRYHIIKLNMEKKLVADCVEYHLTIFKLAEMLNSTFNFVVFFQCSISTIVLCVSMFLIANIKLSSSELTGIMLYLCCMLIEIFLLYAAGNEMTFMSESISDAIYEMNWIDLHQSTIKSLIIMMRRTFRKILFTSGNIIRLSLNSLKSLIKISYSTYNLLQRTS